MQRFSLPSPPSVTKFTKTQRQDCFTILDAGEFADFADKTTDVEDRRHFPARWYGGVNNHAEIVRLAREGDLSSVQGSDDYLAKLESQVIVSSRKTWLDNVTGAVPNIPAFIAGHPMNMRMRIRSRSEAAPLAIIYDPTCSAAVDASEMIARGIVALALVRALSIRRPIDLFFCISLEARKTETGKALGDRYGGAYFISKIDTAPLDLARAAHCLSHPSVARWLGYGSLHTLNGSGGKWPYGLNNLGAACFTDICRQAFPQYTDILAIPALHVDDELKKDPLAWLRKQVSIYASDEERNAA